MSKLIQGDCLVEMAKLPDKSVDLILTDPPYFKVKTDAWDRQWEKPTEFLAWLDSIAAQWQRILKPNGSLYCFASPQMAARVECQIMERFRVINNIVWSKPMEKGKAATPKKTCKETLRSYFTYSERIIFAEHFGSKNMDKSEGGYMAKCDELRGVIFEPLTSYLKNERDMAGHTTRSVVEALSCTTIDHYFRNTQWALPTEKHYLSMRELFNRSGGDFLKKDYNVLKTDYENLRKKYEQACDDYEYLRRPFAVSAEVPYTDVWLFDTVAYYKGKHPCEKPQDLLRHIISASSRPGGVVLDCFMGSGSTGVACRELGREFIGIELDAEYFRKASDRINQSDLLNTP
jgi:site-specific DNA-methyltransferase (adenine-specific)